MKTVYAQVIWSENKKYVNFSHRYFILLEVK